MTELYVKAIAYPQLDYGVAEEFGYVSHYERLKDQEPEAFLSEGTGDDYREYLNPEWAKFQKNYPADSDELHEIAGRNCYQSWHRPNPKTQTNKDYLRYSIIDTDHESVLGHAHVTFAVNGVSRALLLELERHAEHMNINFSVVSQRYVDHGRSSDAAVVAHPLMTEDQVRRLEGAFTYAKYQYDKTFNELREAGYTLKQARGAARAFLPENTETKFLVTGSIRAWRDIIRKRLIDGADIEIREFAREILKELVRIAPNSVQDFAEMHGIEEGK